MLNKFLTKIMWKMMLVNHRDPVIAKTVVMRKRQAGLAKFMENTELERELQWVFLDNALKKHIPGYREIELPWQVKNT